VKHVSLHIHGSWSTRVRFLHSWADVPRLIPEQETPLVIGKTWFLDQQITDDDDDCFCYFQQYFSTLD